MLRHLQNMVEVMGTSGQRGLCPNPEPIKIPNEEMFGVFFTAYFDL